MSDLKLLSAPASAPQNPNLSNTIRGFISMKSPKGRKQQPPQNLEPPSYNTLHSAVENDFEEQDILKKYNFPSTTFSLNDSMVSETETTTSSQWGDYGSENNNINELLKEFRKELDTYKNMDTFEDESNKLQSAASAKHQDDISISQKLDALTQKKTSLPSSHAAPSKPTKFSMLEENTKHHTSGESILKDLLDNDIKSKLSKEIESETISLSNAANYTDALEEVNNAIRNARSNTIEKLVHNGPTPNNSNQKLPSTSAQTPNTMTSLTKQTSPHHSSSHHSISAMSPIAVSSFEEKSKIDSLSKKLTMKLAEPVAAKEDYKSLVLQNMRLQNEVNRLNSNVVSLQERVSGMEKLFEQMIVLLEKN